MTVPVLYLYLFLGSAAVAWALTRVAVRAGPRLGLLDPPGPRKIHDHPIPRSGGLAVFLAFTLVVGLHCAVASWARVDAGLRDLIPAGLHLFLDDFPRAFPRLLLVYAGALGIFLLGLADDRRGLGVGTRLVVQFACAIVVVVFGVRPTLSGIPDWLVWCAGVVWIVGLTNAFNFVDGADGLAAGLGALACLFCAWLLYHLKHPQAAVVLVVLAGVLCGFLRYNFHPARVFLGDSGATFLGFVVATMVLHIASVRGHALKPFTCAVPILVAAVPLYDLLSVVVLRLRSRRPIMGGDQNHFVHRLMRLGFSHRQSVLFMYMVAAIAGLLSMLMPWLGEGQVAILLLLVLALMGLLVIVERAAARWSNGSPPARRAPALGENPLTAVRERLE